MKVFLIGGTGQIGRAVARELADNGHTPVVLARSEASKAKIIDPRIGFVDGSVEDVDLLLEQAGQADATVYLAVNGPQGGTPADRAAIDGILDAYAGTDKAFVLTSGLLILDASNDPFITSATPYTTNPAVAWRAALDRDVLAAADRGVRTMVIRPPLVYGRGGESVFIQSLQRHVAAGNPAFYIRDGSNRIATIHVDDLARIYVAALVEASPGMSFNAVGASVLGYDLAHALAIAAGSSAPVSLTMSEAVDAFGPGAATLALDLRTSDIDLAAILGWSPRSDSLPLALIQGDSARLTAPERASDPAPYGDRPHEGAAQWVPTSFPRMEASSTPIVEPSHRYRARSVTGDLRSRRVTAT
ncbi:NAD-dependent epimerase/dehydratase family protein [Mycobacterium sp. MYCO198283]|uniref:NAD-dependent epimerase/dehydratase family protein n=1 Tax=Mycobacterium sp. MYCO198283 TaxID=2883505 RepID=UPI001E5BE9A7|nr:NAD-dependent epimerase/dehydratase family protein [Mycobacterium sp. MYCO198283]MCG5432158.1 NAD-dependent epimerase/dehydratase family protein [Mycobacterium sp. MYCO198283]